MGQIISQVLMNAGVEIIAIDRDPSVDPRNRSAGPVIVRCRVPMDPLPESGSAVVEIYTRIYLRRAGMPGTKLRTRADLNRALKGLGSPPVRLRFEPNDHQTDALVTAAGMRALALSEPRAFAPGGLTPEIARGEGWTFGVL